MNNVRYVEHLAIQKAYDIKRREILPHFSAMLILALIMHALLLLMWSLVPGTRPFSVPIQALNVRLGGIEDALSKSAQQQGAKGQGQAKMDSAPPVPVTKPSAPAKKPLNVGQAAQAPRRTAPPPKVSPGPKLAAGGQNFGVAEGSPFGNALEGKVEVERYTRQISLQVQAQARNVRLTEGLKQRAQGNRIVVELLLVIAQDGRLQRYSISRSSGFSELDQAAIGAAYNAAPFPPPPAEYSGYGFKVAIFME